MTIPTRTAVGQSVNLSDQTANRLRRDGAGAGTDNAVLPQTEHDRAARSLRWPAGHRRP